jgi:hypothetical protein
VDYCSKAVVVPIFVGREEGGRKKDHHIMPDLQETKNKKIKKIEVVS